MTQRSKKQLIAALLLAACIISAWLLFLTPVQETSHLENLEQADSLLHLTLSDFNIGSNQVSTYSTRIDSHFSRTTYTVSVPTDFSKTQFHSALKNRLSSYQISLPARIIFPQKDMHIYLDYRKTIIRTIRLVTDKDLTIQRSFASIIVAFSGRPSDELLAKITSMGEPIPVAIIMRPPFTLPGWWNEVRKEYPQLFIWLKTSEDDNLLSVNQTSRLTRLKHINEEIPLSTLLSFQDSENQLSRWHQQTSFSFVDMHDAIIFNDELRKPMFNHTFRRFIHRARSGTHPIALIMATPLTVQWMNEELNTFKKGGLYITAPPKISF